MKVNEAEKAASDIEIMNIDIKNIKNGTYIGEYKMSSLVSAKVEVTIKDNKIKDIKLLEHNNGKGKEAEKIPSKVIKKQSLEVDTISGATISSKVILKSIENALSSDRI
ncbi:MAG: FMN-binding protein [Firmicutes bacterium]|nr:FMN-binding protein [Bacillota bacterium]